MPDNTPQNVLFVRGALRQAMIDRFSLQEIRDICFDLGIDADSLDSTTKGTLIRELLARLEQRNGGLTLITWLRANRADTDWPDPFSSTSNSSETATPREQTSVTPTDPAVAPTILTITSPIQMELVRIPAGEFLMGSDPQVDKQAFSDEKPQHIVSLPDFYIARTPVTNAQFAAFAKAENYQTVAEKWKWSWVYSAGSWERVKNADWAHPGGLKTNLLEKDDHPVVQVTWDDAVAFCDWLSETTGRGFRLLSEAEWEKAARGVQARIYPWGDELPTEHLCNSGNRIGTTTPVDSYPQGATPDFGILDMAGNVWEWVADWYEEDYYAKSPKRNPTGPTNGEKRVKRGGCWFNSGIWVRTATRLTGHPNTLGNTSGFRCACFA